jgi:HlyD family secretion protein
MVKKTHKRTLWIGGMVVIVIGAGALVMTSARLGNTQAASTATAATGQVKRETLSTVVESTGSIEPQTTLNLRFGGPGTVAQVNVKVGDHVKQGDVLAKLDTAALDLQLRQDEQALIIQQATYSQTLTADTATISSTQAALASAQAAYAAALQQTGLSAQQVTINCANMTFAKNALDRAQTAYDRLANDNQAKNYLSSDWGPYQSIVNGLADAKTAYDVARSSCNLAKGNINNAPVTAAQSQVAQATANLDNLLSPSESAIATAQVQLELARLNMQQTQLKLADAVIIAPFDGVVTKVKGSRGAAGSSVSIGLADTRQYHIDVLVDETEIAKVQVGQAADITLDGLPGTTLTGKVARIDPSGALVQGVINYNVQIDLDPSTAPLRLYLTANARIIQALHADVLSVPRAAIHTDPAGGQYVEVVDQTGQQTSSQRVNVTLGLNEGTHVEVAGDLKDGDRVSLTVTPRQTTGFSSGQ